MPCPSNIYLELLQETLEDSDKGKIMMEDLIGWYTVNVAGEKACSCENTKIVFNEHTNAKKTI